MRALLPCGAPVWYDGKQKTNGLRAKEGGWFGASAYACEFSRIPFQAFLPVLRDPDFQFLEEEPLPEGYRPGDIVL